MLHRAPISRWLNTALRITERPTHVGIPVFLCPSIRRSFCCQSPGLVAPTYGARSLPWRSQQQQQQQQRRFHAQADQSIESTESTESTAISPAADNPTAEDLPIEKLPKQCTGCGALSQFSLPDQAGYYDLSRKAVRKYLGVDTQRDRTREEDKIIEDVLKNLDAEKLKEQGIDVEALGLTPPPEDEARPSPQPQKAPLCDRCHYLLHNHTGKSIYHPTIDSIKDTLMESPYKYNHVYHILDAADFPMSILPNIHQFLDLMPLRTKNRRSKVGRFYHGQKTEVSFIITRSDLLAPTKPQVDRLLPYLQDVLRDALGRGGRNVRLGNIRCVSAKRSWWTKELREDIWKRGGAGWMVGKVNVGKSQLFEAVFPKGRMDWKPSDHQITVGMYPNKGSDAIASGTMGQNQAAQGDEDEHDLPEDEDLNAYSLLPPAPKETNYPDMPLVSDLPGTTASPIRVPFGNGRGELIDLPGLERTGLEHHVKEEHRLSLIMKSRLVPEQMVIKPGQSLLIGGLIRITPQEPAPIMLSYAFTPIEPHLTSTAKAIAIQEQTSEVNVESIAVPGTGEKTKLAGSFPLQWDVTKQRTGPLTRKDAVGLEVDRLPYRVLATDIIIEGVGWVEIAAQVRTKDLFGPKPNSDADPVTATPLPEKSEPQPEKELSALERLEAMAEDPNKKKKEKTRPPPPPPPTEVDLDSEPNWPVVDVYSPEGKFVGCRRPLNGWMLNQPKVTAAHRRKRPRKSMKGAKKLEKQRSRERDATRTTGSSSF